MSLDVPPNPQPTDDQMEGALFSRTFNSIAKEIVEINSANGWNTTRESEWEESPYKVPAILALCISEVSEAHRAFVEEDFSLFGEELADILIRSLDMAIGLGFDIDSCVSLSNSSARTIMILPSNDYPEDLRSAGREVYDVLFALVDSFSEMLEHFRKNRKHEFSMECAAAISFLIRFSSRVSVDIESCVYKKMEKNRSRGFRHGGKRV